MDDQANGQSEGEVMRDLSDRLAAFDKIDIPKLVDKIVDESAPKLVQMANRLPPLHVGRQSNLLRRLCDHLSDGAQSGFDFSVLPLHDSRYAYWLGTALTPHQAQVAGPPTSSFDDPFLHVSSWCSQVVGLLHPREVKPESLKAKNSEADGIPSFKEQIAWATHLSLPAVLAPAPPESVALATRYGQLLNQALLGLSFTQIWVEVPLCDEPISVSVEDLPPPPPPIATPPPPPPQSSESAPPPQNGPDAVLTAGSRSAPKLSAWNKWARLRDLCDYNAQLFVALTMTSDMPPENELFVWDSEPVRAVIIPHHVFLTNTYGYPCLSRAHQRFLSQMFRLRVQIILRGTEEFTQEGQDPYLKYIRYLQRKSVRITDQDAFEEPYYDYLQSPLQPLADNLESQTYETFEKDPIKYRLYEEAVYLALQDRAEKAPVVVMVLGAGRGPLVLASLRASERASVPVTMYAVEKNPNAVITLQHMSRTMGWEGKVTIVSSDMRVWEAPTKADIIVSELLGSFSDNELSPECLDGAQKFLADDGISIPGKYTSFIAPVSSQKVWKDVRNWKELKQFETAFVCKLHNFCELAPAQPLFEFVHPNRDAVIDNSRYDVKVFRSDGNAYIHGVVGYFDSQLYKDVHMSINPETFSDGMISWFPLYFPLRTPLFVNEGDRIDVHFWRCVSSTKVWYEWCVGVNDTQVTAIHNPNGRSYFIGLST